MRNVILAIMVILAGASLVQGDTEWTSGHHEITEGDVYGEIYIYNEATAVMLGGDVFKLEAFDIARFDMLDGVMTDMRIHDDSIVNLWAGDLSRLGITENGALNLYAYDIIHHPTGGHYDRGWLEGKYLEDDSYFSFDFVEPDTFSHINVVPEPAAANSNSKVIDGIEYYVQTDKAVYVLGEEVQMLYKVTNLRDEDVTFSVLPSPPWNFWVRKDGNGIFRAVNRWWGMPTQFTLGPDEWKEFPHSTEAYVWDMRDKDGNTVDPGECTVIGGLYNGLGDYEHTKVGVPIKIISELVEAVVDVVPDTVNLRSKGKWINCKIWLPEDYNVADVNSETIFIEDEIPAERIWFNEEQNVVMAKFRRSDVEQIVQPGLVELTVTGQLTDGTPFEGNDTIRVIDKGKAKQLCRKRRHR